MALPAPRRKPEAELQEAELQREAPTRVEKASRVRAEIGRVLEFPGNGEREETRIIGRPQDDFRIGQITIHKARHKGSEEKEFVDACIRTKEAIRRMLDLKQIPDGPYALTFYDKAFVPEEGPLAFPGIVINVYDSPAVIRRFIYQHAPEAIRLQAKRQSGEVARHPQANGKRRAA